TDQASVSGAFVPAVQPNILVLESTYGNRLHAHRPAQEQRIVDRVRDVLSEGGNVLFPTFALGRAQEVLLVLGKAMREGELPRTSIYADGLVRTISRVYAKMPDDLSPACRRMYEDGFDPIFPEDLPIMAVRDEGERKRIVKGPPCVVVSSSGMLQGGASQFYARNWIGDARNLILLTGYQDEESPGQALLNLAEAPAEQPRYFKLGGVRTEVQCQVESTMLSAHADGGELAAIAAKLQPQLVLLVHGDATARKELSRLIMASTRAHVELPRNGHTYSAPSGERRAVRPHRDSPLSAWPPWDPNQPRELNLEKFHGWLVTQDPPIKYLLIDELAEIWKAPKPPTDDDLSALRRAIFAEPQPYFIPDVRRPYMLSLAAPENLAAAPPARQPSEAASGVLRTIFPPESGLRRFGFFPEEGVVRLEFRFPLAAKKHFARRFAEASDRTGWKLEVADLPVDHELGAAVGELLGGLPGPGKVVVRAAEHRVDVDLSGWTGPIPTDDLGERFERKTGCHLNLFNAPTAADPFDQPPEDDLSFTPPGDQAEDVWRTIE
ncbi:MAG: MBL fold metallo-hydrolase, partial [Planctomycetia bacterium]